MRRFNPEPVFLTSKSFTSLGAGVACYAFSVENQSVIQSCYMCYNVVLHFFLSFSKAYDAVLQNRRSRAYMCACADVRAYMRAPVCVCSCYIATSQSKSLKRNGKSVAGWCSRCVVWSCYTRKNKISGIYSAEIRGAETARSERAERSPEALRNGAGEGVRTGGKGISAGGDVISKKWRISAVFAVPFNGMFNAVMFNVCEKWRRSAVFRAVGTFFLKMCALGRIVRPARSGCPGGDPPSAAGSKPICPVRIFFRFSDRIVFWRGWPAVQFFTGVRGMRVFGSKSNEQDQRSGR